MKLLYLANVQKLLEDYDFQDKYKVMLDLEETLSLIEFDGHIDQSTLLEIVGTPVQFVTGVIKKYNLTPTGGSAMNSSASTSTTNTQLQGASNPTPMSTNQIPRQESPLNAKSSMDTTQNLSNSNTNLQIDGNGAKSKKQKVKKDKNKNKDRDNKTFKAPFKIIFSIITWLLSIIAAFVFSFAIIISVVFLVLVDTQTALIFLFGVLFFLIAILLALNFIKNIIYSIIDRKVKVVKLLMMLIVTIILIVLSTMMLRFAITTVNDYVAANLYTVQTMFTNRDVDISNIDWENMNIGGYVKLIGNGIKATF